MKRFFGLLLLVLGGCQSMHQQPEILTSEAGHKVIFSPMRKAETVALVVDWPSDWSSGEGHNPATAHLAAQLVMEGGSVGRSAADTAEAFSQLGARSYLWPRFDSVRGLVQVEARNLKRSAQLMNQALLDPAFEQRWLDRMARNRKAEQQEASVASSTLVGQTLAYRFLKNTQQRQFLQFDNPELYAAVSTDDLRNWHQRSLGVNTAVVSVAGNISKRDALAAVDQLLVGLPHTVPATMEAIDTEYKAVKLLVHKADAAKTSLALLAPLPSLQQSSVLDRLGSMILGGGAESRLIKAVRDKLRASYTFSSFLSGYDEHNRYMLMSGEVATDKLEAVQLAVSNAYWELVEQGPTTVELEKNKKLLLRQLNESINFEAANVAGALIDYERYGWSIHQLTEEIELLESVSVLSMKSYLRRNWPKVDQLITIAVSADAQALTDACVIQQAAEAVDC